MRRWLSGFAYHIDLHWWEFAAASLGALLIALVTVGGTSPSLASGAAEAGPGVALRMTAFGAKRTLVNDRF